MKNLSDEIIDKNTTDVWLLFNTLTDIISDMQSKAANFKIKYPDRQSEIKEAFDKIDNLLHIANYLLRTQEAIIYWNMKFMESEKKRQQLEQENFDLSKRILIMEEQEKFGQDQ